jgi:hypothetical protein
MSITIKHPRHVTTNDFNRRHVGFQRILTHLEPHIFTMTTTFPTTSISNHDLEFVNKMDVAFGFLGYSLMKELMGDSPIK